MLLLWTEQQVRYTFVLIPMFCFVFRFFIINLNQLKNSHNHNYYRFLHLEFIIDNTDIIQILNNFGIDTFTCLVKNALPLCRCRTCEKSIRYSWSGFLWYRPQKLSEQRQWKV